MVQRALGLVRAADADRAVTRPKTCCSAQQGSAGSAKLSCAPARNTCTSERIGMVRVSRALRAFGVLRVLGVLSVDPLLTDESGRKVAWVLAPPRSSAPRVGSENSLPPVLDLSVVTQFTKIQPRTRPGKTPATSQSPCRVYTRAFMITEESLLLARERAGRAVSEGRFQYPFFDRVEDRLASGVIEQTHSSGGSEVHARAALARRRNKLHCNVEEPCSERRQQKHCTCASANVQGKRQQRRSWPERRLDSYDAMRGSAHRRWRRLLDCLSSS